MTDKKPTDCHEDETRLGRDGENKAVPNIEELTAPKVTIDGETETLAEAMIDVENAKKSTSVGTQKSEAETIDELLRETDAMTDETVEEAREAETDAIVEITEAVDDEDQVEEDEALGLEHPVRVTIDGVTVTVEEGTTIVEAALLAGIKIPTLCYLRGVNAIGSCRMCVVEIKGGRSLVASCVYPVNDGLEVYTDTEKVREARRINMELILSNHRMDCLTCERNRDCELRSMAADLNIDDIRFQTDNLKPQHEMSAKHLIRDNSKCILCRRCVAVCNNREQVGVIGAADRGFSTHIGSEFERGLGEVSCVACGQCIQACPTGALTIKRSVDHVLDAINDPEKIVVATTAPAVRVGLGDRFGMPLGADVEGKMVTALRRLGFDLVFDVDWGADMTVMEEANELIERVTENRDLPMFTSCCPAWIRYMEFYHPDMLRYLSTCRSPQGEIGGLLKTYYAEKSGIDPHKMVCVSIMPCTAKKYEVGREEQRLPNGCMPTDYSITTRELADMITNAGILFDQLPDGTFDRAMGESSGAGDIFGASGGVMEAALRTAAATLSPSGETPPLVFNEVRGMEGVKEATYHVGDTALRTCTISNLNNAEAVIQKIKAGEVDYDFIEVMACPGGCVNGGGQPLHTSFEKMVESIAADRALGLYKIDDEKKLRRSDQNPEIIAVYDDYLGKPGSHKAHEVLHTTYHPMNRYPV